ncbi:CRISPR-associated protein [Halorhodospira halochloris]|uniref:CRISPR system Cms protein Csm5 n=1 Tax=Halorhodospira halochloris TaxID=1052 RepID=A0A0X8XB15_HALHR|nr:RAMP superfamily CRISPR-associated protein [Halorhodospira halochloris]MBK1651896.1 hypothetical protein [Halorhodospira halochloris]BAU58762.1 CRISPR-associated protein [Halorhodospira halochloris]
MTDIRGARPETENVCIEVVTPLHIGDGESLIKDADFVQERPGHPFRVIDKAGLERRLAEQGGDEVEAYLAHQEMPGLQDLVTLAGGASHAPGYDLPPHEPGHAPASPEIRSTIKDAWLRPLLPGSALKGALRTAWIAQHLRDQVIQPRAQELNKPPRFAAARFLGRLTSAPAHAGSGRPGPNSDAFRVLRPRDAQAPRSALSWVDIRIAKSPRDGKVGWHVTTRSGRRQVDDWSQATALNAEALAPGTVLATQISWDGLLCANESAWRATGNEHIALPRGFCELRDVLIRHARHQIQREKKDLFAWELKAAYRTWQQLEQQLEQAIQQGGAPLRLGFGIGWLGMTGDWLSDETFHTVLAETHWKVKQPHRFPKTRRLVVERGQPQAPLGWVILWPADSGPPPTGQDPEEQKDREDPGDAGHPWVNTKIAELQKAHNSSLEEVLRGKKLAQACQLIDDLETRSEVLADIRRRWQERGWWNDPRGRAMKQARQIYGELTGE